jgi:hypothetical protein
LPTMIGRPPGRARRLESASNFASSALSVFIFSTRSEVVVLNAFAVKAFLVLVSTEFAPRAVGRNEHPQHACGIHDGRKGR